MKLSFAELLRLFSFELQVCQVHYVQPLDTISEIAEVKNNNKKKNQHLVCSLDSISSLGVSFPCGYSGDDYLMLRIQYIDGGTIYKRFNTKEDVLLKALRTSCHHLKHFLT